MKDTKIKLMTLALTAVMTLSATACAKEKKDAAQDSSGAASSEEARVTTNTTDATAASEAKDTTEALTSPADTTTNAALDTTPAAPAANADTKAYADAYIDIINGYGASNEDVKFAFAHIDGDEIPELIVSDFRAYQKEQREDRKIFALSIYTYKEDQAVTVLKDARSDNGIIEFYCYNPYSGSLCHYQTPDFGDASVPAYILKHTFMDEYIEGREGNWVLYRYSTPNWVLAGKDSAAEAVSFLKSGSIPQDTEYELHPEYEPYTDEYYASLPTLPPNETEPYAPDSSKISDYSKYYGNYKGYDDFLNLSIYDVKDGKITFDWTFTRIAELQKVSVPIEDNVAVFYYQGYYDENFDGINQEDEYFCRKVWLVLFDDYVEMHIEDVDRSELVPELDVSASFVASGYVFVDTYHYSKI